MENTRDLLYHYQFHWRLAPRNLCKDWFLSTICHVIWNQVRKFQGFSNAPTMYHCKPMGVGWGNGQGGRNLTLFWIQSISHPWVKMITIPKPGVKKPHNFMYKNIFRKFLIQKIPNKGPFPSIRYTSMDWKYRWSVWKDENVALLILLRFLFNMSFIGFWTKTLVLPVTSDGITRLGHSRWSPFQIPHPRDITYNQNSYPGDRPHNQIPVGSPSLPLPSQA